MTRHASAEDLAGLDLDALTPRKAARVRGHVASCVECTQLSVNVSVVPTLLASVPYPAMPPSLATQLDAALAREGVQGLTNAPATEAGRRDLPARHARKVRADWHLPRMSVLGTRLVAAAGALVIVGVGGYEIATHAAGNSSGSATSSAGSASLPSVRQMTLGPTVQYGGPAAAKTVQTIHANTNFTHADLATQAIAAVRVAKLEGATSAPANGAAAPSASGTFASNNPVRAQALPPAGVSSCLDGVVGSQPVQLVETARYEGHPATIIVTAATPGHPAQVWAVRPACSASHPDVLDHQTLSHI
jgi:hypothetical protein